MRGGPRSFLQGFPCLAVLWILPRRPPLRLRGFHPLWPAFPKRFRWVLRSLMQSEPRGARAPVWAPPISLAATLGIDVSFFSSGYLDVSVRRVPLHALLFHAWIHGSSPCGFPHSETRGSLDICSSPRLFAAYRVFLRLSVPRHPPCALSCLTSPEAYIALHAPVFFSLSSLDAAVSRRPQLLGCLSLFFDQIDSFSIRFSRYGYQPSL